MPVPCHPASTWEKNERGHFRLVVLGGPPKSMGLGARHRNSPATRSGLRPLAFSIRTTSLAGPITVKSVQHCADMQRDINIGKWQVCRLTFQVTNFQVGRRLDSSTSGGIALLPARKYVPLCLGWPSRCDYTDSWRRPEWPQNDPLIETYESDATFAIVGLHHRPG